MKRLQIYIDDELDDRLKFQAIKQRTTKSALVRQYVAERLRWPPPGPDPLDVLVGAVDIDIKPGDIDKVVYDR